MATALTLKSGNAASGGDNASGELIFEIGENYGSGASTITFKTRAAGADTNSAGALQTPLILNTLYWASRYSLELCRYSPTLESFPRPASARTEASRAALLS